MAELSDVVLDDEPRCRPDQCRPNARIIKLDHIEAMGNRHHNKGLRAAVRATMASTGESYQTVLLRLRTQKPKAAARASDVDLIPIDYFGIALTIATFEVLGDLSCVITPGGISSRPFPQNPLFALARRRGSS